MHSCELVQARNQLYSVHLHASINHVLVNYKQKPHWGNYKKELLVWGMSTLKPLTQLKYACNKE